MNHNELFKEIGSIIDIIETFNKNEKRAGTTVWKFKNFHTIIRFLRVINFSSFLNFRNGTMNFDYGKFLL